jgi:hypothetical protein
MIEQVTGPALNMDAYFFTRYKKVIPNFRHSCSKTSNFVINMYHTIVSRPYTLWVQHSQRTFTITLSYFVDNFYNL